MAHEDRRLPGRTRNVAFAMSTLYHWARTPRCYLPIPDGKTCSEATARGPLPYPTSSDAHSSTNEDKGRDSTCERAADQGAHRPLQSHKSSHKCLGTRRHAGQHEHCCAASCSPTSPATSVSARDYMPARTRSAVDALGVLQVPPQVPVHSCESSRRSVPPHTVYREVRRPAPNMVRLFTESRVGGVASRRTCLATSLFTRVIVPQVLWPTPPTSDCATVLFL